MGEEGKSKSHSRGLDGGEEKPSFRCVAMEDSEDSKFGVGTGCSSVCSDRRKTDKDVDAGVGSGLMSSLGAILGW